MDKQTCTEIEGKYKNRSANNFNTRKSEQQSTLPSAPKICNNL